MWQARILPVLAAHLSADAGVAESGRDLQLAILEAIRKDESIVERRLIDYGALVGKFPTQTGASIRRIIDHYVFKKAASGFVGCDFRKALEKAIGYLRHEKADLERYKNASRKIVEAFEKAAGPSDTMT